MELFYSNCIEQNLCYFSAEESNHLCRVLRHKEGDKINVIDGVGGMYDCVLINASPKGAVAKIEYKHNDWHGHNYTLTMAVCPTKNNDRFEWFAEKATELGVDKIIPIIASRSERKVYKKERIEKIVSSATKQSLKAKFPIIEQTISIDNYLDQCGADSLKLIAYCFDDDSTQRQSIKEVLNKYEVNNIEVLIGPEGDFSAAEVNKAIQKGFIPIHLGTSRLRTETAALTAVQAVYLKYM